MTRPCEMSRDGCWPRHGRVGGSSAGMPGEYRRGVHQWLWRVGHLVPPSRSGHLDCLRAA